MSIHQAVMNLVSVSFTVTTVIYLALRTMHFIATRPRRWMSK